MTDHRNFVWEKSRIGDFLRIKHGYAFKGEHFASDGRFVLLTPGNFKPEGGFQSRGDREKYYNGPVPEGFILHQGDLLVALTDLTQNAPILGSCAIVPENGRFLHNQRLGKVVEVDSERIDPRFLYYIFNYQAVRDQIKATATGATVRHTAPDRIYAVEISLPPIATQRRIAEILRTYDAAIQNNTRRIQILEEMAQSIYHEWFVNFRFPGHEQVEMVESKIGPIPAGWEVRRVGDRFTAILGGTPSRRTAGYWQGGTIPWINSGKVNDLRIIDESEFITSKGLERSSTELMPKRTTVLAITGATLGQVSLLELVACANQSVVGVFDPNGSLAEYIYLFFVHTIAKVIQHASGGAQQHINKGIVEDVLIPIPDEQTARVFGTLIRPTFDEMAVLLRKNSRLRITRDLLLPKLVSGEIDPSAFLEPESVVA